MQERHRRRSHTLGHALDRPGSQYHHRPALLILTDTQRVKSLGYALDDEEDEVGFRCLAAPIFDHRGGVAAAISVVGVTDELTAERVSSLIQSVRATAASISELLGSDTTE